MKPPARRDQQDERPSPTVRLCAAFGCPERGTISANGGDWVCRYHFGANPGDWPEVTRQRRIAADQPPPPEPPPAGPVDVEAVRKQLKSFRIGPTDGKAWARRLLDGRPVSEIQERFAREALRMDRRTEEAADV